MSELDKLVRLTIKFTIIRNAISCGWIAVVEQNNIILKKHLHYLNEIDKNFPLLLINLLKQ